MALFEAKVSYDEYQSLLDQLRDVHAENDELRAAEVKAPTEWLEAVMTKRIIVHLTTDQTIDGSLVARMDDGVVLRAARLMDGSPQGTAMAGEVFIPREKVAFAQLDG